MKEISESRIVSRARWRLLVAAVIGFAAFAAGLALRPAHAWTAFLVSSFFFLTLSLGSMVFLAMMNVSNARWHTALKRVPESIAAYLPVGALGALALLAGVPWLYHWAEPGAIDHDPLLQAKASYLNTESFAVRTIVVVTLWVLFAVLMRRLASPRQPVLDFRHGARGMALSAMFLVVFPFSFSMASIDWLMSLDPHWTSSIFGLYNIAGLLSAAVAGISVLVITMRRRGLLPNVSEDHLHDLGKLLFGFSTVWAYLWFSQYLLIWYTNLPEENTHYFARLTGNVSILFFQTLLLSWAIPFVLLLSKAGKRSEKTLLAASALVLAGRWLDIHLLVTPSVFPVYPGITGLDLALFVAFGGMFLATVDRAFEKPAPAKEAPGLTQPIPVPSSVAIPAYADFEEPKKRILPMLLAAILVSAGYVQAQTQRPLRIGSVSVTADARTRIESWDWFRSGASDNAYTYSGALLRLGFSQQRQNIDWQLEFAAPVLLRLPESAVAPGAQGQLGLGATYFVSNDRKRDTGMVFVKQGFLRIKRGDNHAVRLGRFEFIDGSETTPADETLAAVKRERVMHRLIGNFGWSHIGRSVDGVQYVYRKPATNFTVVAARPTRGNFQVDGWGDLDVGLLSVSVTRQVAFKKSAAEWRVFGVQYHDWRRVLKTDNRPVAVRSGDSGNVRITSAGGNYLHAVSGAAGKFDFLVWGVLQAGTWGVLDHRAGAAVVEIGYQPPVKLKPWFRAGYSHGSGDGNPNDGEHNTFFQILPTPRVYARTPFYNMMNNEDTFGELTVRPHQKVSIRSSVHWLRLEERNDLWYQGGGAFQPWTFGYVGRPSNGNRSLATVFDLGAEIQLNRNVALGAYFADAESKSVTSSIYPDDKRARFGYVELRYRR